MIPNNPKGWHSRGYLPHYDNTNVTQFITLRLADSLPAYLIEAWKEELQQQTLLDTDRQLTLQRRIERYLDEGTGACYLREPLVARMIETALYYFDESRYRLLSWVIMPNHLHVLLVPNMNRSLSKIVHSLKSYTAHKANAMLGRQGQFWFEDYFDRYIRDAKHYDAVVRYIEMNPVKARLCSSPGDWRYGSAWWRCWSAGVPPAE